jgi:hypothetical protein
MPEHPKVYKPLKLSHIDMTNPDIGIKLHTVTPNNTTQHNRQNSMLANM